LKTIQAGAKTALSPHPVNLRKDSEQAKTKTLKKREILSNLLLIL
jgi:hypothetical protein